MFYFLNIYILIDYSSNYCDICLYKNYILMAFKPANNIPFCSGSLL